MSQSHDSSHDDLATSVGAQHQWFPEQQLILDDRHEIRLRVNYNLGLISSPKIELSSSMQVKSPWSSR